MASPASSNTNPFIGPVKRSITIAGHQTSISLEPPFWAALEAAARGRGVPLSALVADIDARRVTQAAPPNLASVLRSWILADALGNASNSQ